MYTQLLDIQNSLGSNWSHIGSGRDDGKKAGEFSPIFFRSDHWECSRQATFWLSKTPDVVSKSWDASLMRIVTMGTFRHRKTGASIIVMSTHLDHSGALAREESARLLLKIAKRWVDESIGTELPPLFLGGDFNSTPDSKPYQVITSPVSGMKDISGLVPEQWRYGNPEITYTSFGQESPLRIDYLFVLEPSCLNFLTFGVLQNRFDDGLYLSDHRPVVADVELPTLRSPIT